MIAKTIVLILLAPALFASPRAAAAQPVPAARVGILSTANPRSNPIYKAYEQRLRELGYVEGKNLTIEFRNADGKVERLPDLALELVRLKVDAIVTATNPGMDAARSATDSTPIVMLAVNYDPIALGYVASLARPGANVTGLFFQHREVTSKRLSVFKELLPSLSRVVVVSDSQTGDQLTEAQAAQALLGLTLQPLEMQHPPYDFESVLRPTLRTRGSAIFVLESPFIFRASSQIAQLALKNRLPSSFAFSEYVEAGGLMSYGVNFLDMWRRGADYTDKILRGARPANLPVEQPTKFELVINRKTARALGVTIPPSFLLRADRVIE